MIKLSHPFFKTGLPLIGATVAGWLVLSATLERRIHRKVHFNPQRPTITFSITLLLKRFDIPKLIWPLSSTPPTRSQHPSQEARQAVPESEKARTYDPEQELEVSFLPSHSITFNHHRHNTHNINTLTNILPPIAHQLNFTLSTPEDSKGVARNELRE
jgi:hypothetical protein